MGITSRAASTWQREWRRHDIIDSMKMAIVVARAGLVGMHEDNVGCSILAVGVVEDDYGE